MYSLYYWLDFGIIDGTVEPGNGHYSSWEITRSMDNFNHNFQSSARPLIVTSCTELHCHCFLCWCTKTRLAFLLVPHSTDQFLVARRAVVIFATPKLKGCSDSVDLRPRGSGDWQPGTPNWHTHYVQVHTSVSNRWTGIWTGRMDYGILKSIIP